MMSLVVLVVVASAAVASGLPAVIYPAGVSPAACPNYPYCGPDPLEVPLVPGGEAITAAQARVRLAQIAVSQPYYPSVPGIAAHEAAVNEQLASMGIAPSLLRHEFEVAKLQQAQDDFVAMQAQLAASLSSP